MVKYKLCWMHKDSNSKLSENFMKCECGSPIIDDAIPNCHINCDYYAKCRRAFELGRFCNNFWDMPQHFTVSSVDHNAMRVTKIIRNDIVAFVESGANLVLFSASSGNGKSLRATSIANTYISEVVKNAGVTLDCDNIAAYAHIPRIVNDYELYDKLSYDNSERVFFYNYLQRLNTADLVVWDEYGYNSGSRIESVVLRSIVSSRINEGKSNIFVINKSLEQFKAVVDDYDYTRIVNSSNCVEFKGLDHRCNTVNNGGV